MSAAIRCETCAHYDARQSACRGWEYPAHVQDTTQAAARCLRYTDVHGRETEMVDGHIRFKPGTDALAATKEATRRAVQAASAAQSDVDAILQSTPTPALEAAKTGAEQPTPARPRPGTPRPDVSNERIAELYRQGMRVDDIAFALQTTKTTVYARLARMGLREHGRRRAKPAPAEGQVVISAERQSVAVDVRVPSGAALGDLLDVLRAIAGSQAMSWRVRPVAFQLVRDEAARC